MNPFSNPRTRRSATRVVLLAWLFATSVGWANACLLEEHDGHGTAVESVSQAVTAADAAVAQAVADTGQRDAVATPAKAACLKVCDDESRSQVTPKYTPSLSDIAILAPTLLVWTDTAALAPERRAWDELRPQSAGPPLRVRYSRLAL